MTQAIDLLEDLQKTYASQYDVTILFTDEYGELVLPAEGNNELCNTLLDQEQASLLDEIKDSLNQEWSISKPTVYDVMPGIHVVVAPVKCGDHATYFLWAGVMVEEQSKEWVKEQLDTNYDTEIYWDEVLQQTPTITSENKQNWIQWTNKLADLAALCLQEEAATPAAHLPTDLLRETTREEQLDVSALLSRFLDQSGAFDFLGLAEKQEEDAYQVTYVAGEGAETFHGATFSPGQGFLGRVLLTGKQAYWENVESDPRSIFFRSFSFRPKSLFCEPIKQRDGSTALLFGGSFSRKRISSEEVALGRTVAVLLEVRLSMNALQVENTQQLNRLTSLVDICKLMAFTPDMKRILFILVDISINLVEGPFSCVVLKDEKTEKLKLVSRGDVTGSLRAYAKDVATRYDDAFFPSYTDAPEPCLYQINEADYVIECPLCHGDELLGVLCVGIADISDAQLKEHLAFLHTLSIIGAVSLQLTKHGDTGIEEEKVEALHRAVEQFDPNTFAVTEAAAVLAAEFTTELHLPAATGKAVIQACQLSFYTNDFIGDNFPNSQLAAILEEGRALIEGQSIEMTSKTKQASYIFALVHAYVENEHDLEKVAFLQEADKEIYQQFVAFVRDKQVVEQEFSLSGNTAVTREVQSITDTIKNKMNLSPREQEVLALVMEGLNNRDIAEKLYISDHTVKNHVTKIFQKLAVSDRAQAISKVYQLMYQ